MRILHVTEAGSGGVSRYLVEMFKARQRFQPDLHMRLIVPSDEAHYFSEIADSGELITYRRTRRSVGQLVTMCRTARRVCDEYQPDIVHLHSSFAGILRPFIFRKKVVIFTPHCWSFEAVRHPVLKCLTRYIERRLASFCNKIICVSEHEKRVGSEAGICADRLQVVLTGLDERRARSSDSPDRLRRGKPFRVLFVGRLDRQKGVDWFFPAFARLPPDQFHLTVVGDSIRSQSPRVPRRPNVKFMGWASNAQDMDAYYDAADCVVVPSRWEAMPLVPIEALRRGVPIIVSDVGALLEVSGADGRVGRVFRFGDEASFREAMFSMDAAKLHVWCQAALQRFHEVFRIERQLRQMLEVYLGALARGDTA